MFDSFADGWWMESRVGWCGLYRASMRWLCMQFCVVGDMIKSQSLIFVGTALV